MKTIAGRLLRDNRGTTAIEYGLIAALVVLGAFAGLRNFADVTVNMWTNVSTYVSKG